VRARDSAGNVGGSRRLAVAVANPLGVRVTVAETRRRPVLARGLSAQVSCSRPCRVAARLELGSRTARRLGVPRRIAGTVARRLRPRHERLRLRVRPSIRRRLAGTRRLAPRLVVVATDAGRRSRTVRRSVVLRR
jgi:hypothetical protein